MEEMRGGPLRTAPLLDLMSTQRSISSGAPGSRGAYGPDTHPASKSQRGNPKCEELLMLLELPPCAVYRFGFLLRCFCLPLRRLLRWPRRTTLLPETGRPGTTAHTLLGQPPIH